MSTDLIEKNIEGVLFYEAVPVSKTKLKRLLDINDQQLTTGLETLSKRLENGATRIVETEKDVTLTTAPQLSELIGGLAKKRTNQGLGKAGMETLAIILYRGPVRRSDIDYIRGVNSNYAIRTLLLRGFVKKVQNMYRVTPRLLMHLGVTRREELPDYQSILNKLSQFEATYKEDA